MNKIVCVGLGYIGSPIVALLANRSHQVHGVNVLQSTVDTINQGKIHIVEPELDTFVASAVNSGNLKADVFIIGFRDINIVFTNELSMLCDKFGIDVWKMIELANRHSRVNILQLVDKIKKELWLKC